MSVSNKPKKRIKTAIGIALNAIAWVALIALFYFLMSTSNGVHSTAVGNAGLIVGTCLLLVGFSVFIYFLIFVNEDDKIWTYTIVNCAIAFALGMILLFFSIQYLSTTTCSDCGRWKAATDSYCTDCGTKLPQIRHICPVCNEERDTDFCGICGTEIVEVN